MLDSETKARIDSARGSLRYLAGDRTVLLLEQAERL
jgi:hypothetical protein